MVLSFIIGVEDWTMSGTPTFLPFLDIKEIGEDGYRREWTGDAVRDRDDIGEAFRYAAVALNQHRRTAY